MLSRQECCEICTLQAFAGDGPVLPFRDYGLKDRLLVLRGRVQSSEDGPNPDVGLAPLQRLGARACAAIIDSGDCHSYSVVEKQKEGESGKYLALLTKECQFFMLE